MDLTGSAFKKPFKEVTTFVNCFKYMFHHAGARKASFLAVMKVQNNGTPVPMPPDLAGTRWNAWFVAVQYHNRYFKFLYEFLAKEMEISSCPPDSVTNAFHMM
ncbi:UNVERIFIED_CONTAM: hypothetical protein FKN15_051153 [Acipenser sinensis]